MKEIQGKMKVCQVGDKSLSGIYLLFIQRNRARAKKNSQQYHREFSTVLSITFIKIQHPLGPEMREFLSMKSKMKVCHVEQSKRSYAANKRTIAF